MKYKYKVKNDRIDAIQVSRTKQEELILFGDGKIRDIEIPRHPNGKMSAIVDYDNGEFIIEEGDYVIKNFDGSLSSINKKIFESVYEKDNRIIISDHLTDEDMDNIVEEAIDYMVKHLRYERK